MAGLLQQAACLEFQLLVLLVMLLVLCMAFLGCSGPCLLTHLWRFGPLASVCKLLHHPPHLQICHDRCLLVGQADLCHEDVQVPELHAGHVGLGQGGYWVW